MSNKLPSHDVYTVIDRGANQKGFWLRVGAAWTNADGSLNVKLDATPTNGTLNIRLAKSKDDAA